MSLGLLVGVSGIFLAVGLLGYRQSRHSTDGLAEFMLANRRLPLWMAWLSLAATWIGGGYINGTAEAVFDPAQGLVWCQAPWCYALSLILGGCMFAGPMRRRGYRTMLDLFDERYGQRMAAYLYIPALVGDLFWTAAILAALGGTLGVMFDLNVSFVVILAAGVVIAYTVSGGLWSVAMSDVIQLTCIVGGLAAALPFVLAHCGGITQMFGDYHHALGVRARLFPEGAAWTGADAWGWSWIDSALLLIFGGIPWQVYFQRVLASRSPRTAVVMSITAGFACLFIALAPMLIGMGGVCLDWSSFGLERPTDPALILPVVLRHAVPTVVSLVGLTAIAAAVMSSVDSSILSSSSMFAWNVFRPLAGMDSQDPRLNVVLRLAIVVLGALAAILALQVSSVYQLWFFCADLVYVVLFPQLVMALFNRHSTAAAAAIGATTALLLRGAVALLLFERFATFAAVQGLTERIEMLPWRSIIMLASLAVIAGVSYLQRAFARCGIGIETLMTPPQESSRPVNVLLSFGVHLYTSAGLVAGLMTIHFIMSDDYKRAFYAMFVAVVIDATDGTLARAADVKRHVPWIDGRKLDDIVDFINYTFVPIVMIWHAGWLPEPVWLFCTLPLIASVFAFVHQGAKQEERGFFQGFPSYWNIVVFYIALLHDKIGPMGTAAILVFLSVLSVTPIGFVYPNRAPRWKLFFLGGTAVWAAILLAIVRVYPAVPMSWVVISLIYPTLYAILSLYLDWRDRFHWMRR